MHEREGGREIFWEMKVVRDLGFDQEMFWEVFFQLMKRIKRLNHIYCGILGREVFGRRKQMVLPTWLK